MLGRSINYISMKVPRYYHVLGKIHCVPKGLWECLRMSSFLELEHDAPGEYAPFSFYSNPQNYQLWVSCCQICKQFLLFLRKGSVASSSSSSLQKAGVATAIIFDCSMSTKPLAHEHVCSLQLGMWKLENALPMFSVTAKACLLRYWLSKNMQWLHIMQWKI